MTPLPTQSAGESKTASAAKVNGKTMGALFKEFSLDENSQCFIGHAMDIIDEMTCFSTSIFGSKNIIL